MKQILINNYQQGGILDTASDAYSDFSNSPWNTAYDVINTGLYVAAPFTNGITLVPAMAMSIGQGLAAVNNMVHEGTNLNNTLDVAGGVFASPAKLVMNQIMKSVNKGTKLIKRSNLFKTVSDPSHKVGEIELAKTYPSLFSLAKKDKKYIPIFSYSLAVPTIGNAQITNDLTDNYWTYALPYFQYKTK